MDRDSEHGRQVAPPEHGDARNGALGALLRGWVVALCVFVLVAAGGAVAALQYPQQWQATAIVSFTPRVEAGISPDTVALVAQGYAVRVTSDRTTSEIAGGLPEIAPDDLSTGTATELEAGTGNLRIMVTLDDRASAVDAANGAAAALIVQARGDDLVASAVTAEATERGAVTTPPRSLLLAAALGAAVLLAVVAGVLAGRWRQRQQDRRARARQAEQAAVEQQSDGRPSNRPLKARKPPAKSAPKAPSARSRT